MLYTEEAVRANIRNRDGQRVFFLGKGDTLTPGARDYLRRERIAIRSGEEAKIEVYHLQGGGYLTEKPEHMTHLRGDILVPKTHPVIALRGAMDTLQAELLLSQLAAPELQRELGEILSLARQILSREVMEEPLEEATLCGLTEAEQRKHSHLPQKYYGQPHFMPEVTDGAAILQLNRARCAARAAELACARAFPDGARPDIQKALNRMSSMIYILMIRLKAKM
jgi:ethanolamine utilization cobalamin adenosyltransferase